MQSLVCDISIIWELVRSADSQAPSQHPESKPALQQDCPQVIRVNIKVGEALQRRTLRSSCWTRGSISFITPNPTITTGEHSTSVTPCRMSCLKCMITSHPHNIPGKGTILFPIYSGDTLKNRNDLPMIAQLRRNGELWLSPSAPAVLHHAVLLCHKCKKKLGWPREKRDDEKFPPKDLKTHVGQRQGPWRQNSIQIFYISKASPLGPLACP